MSFASVGKACPSATAGRRGGPCGPRPGSAAAVPCSFLQMPGGRLRPSPRSLSLQRPPPRGAVWASVPQPVPLADGGHCGLPAPGRPQPLAAGCAAAARRMAGGSPRGPASSIIGQAACQRGPGKSESNVADGARCARGREERLERKRRPRRRDAARILRLVSRPPLPPLLPPLPRLRAVPQERRCLSEATCPRGSDV